MSKKVRVFVVDDHELVRHGVKRLLELSPDVEWVGDADNGVAAISLSAELQPDVVLMDVSMPGISGVDATRQLRATVPQVRVLALTFCEQQGTLNELLAVGASGIVLKAASANELLQAIRAVAAGGTYIDPRMAAKVIAAFVGSSIDQPRITEREVDVLHRIARGFSNREIGVTLGVSVKTIETYKARAMDKLGLRSRADIVELALQRGWLRPSST